MMQRFGSWIAYREAPRHIVAEQIIEWSATCQAEYDANKEPPPA